MRFPAKRTVRGRPTFGELDKAYSTGDFRTAINIGEKLVGEYPENAVARYKLALVLSRSGQVLRAIHLLDQAAERDDGSLAAKIARVRRVTLEKQELAASRASDLVTNNALLSQELAPERLSRAGANIARPTWKRIRSLQRLSSPSAAVYAEIARIAVRSKDFRAAHSALVKLSETRDLTEVEALWAAESELATTGDVSNEWLARINNIRKSKKRSPWIIEDLMDAIGASEQALCRLEEAGFRSSTRAKTWTFASRLAKAAGRPHEAETFAVVSATLDNSRQRHFRAGLLAEQVGDTGVALAQYHLCDGGQSVRSAARLRRGVVEWKNAGHAEEAVAVLYPFWREFDVGHVLERRLLGQSTWAEDEQPDGSLPQTLDGVESPRPAEIWTSLQRLDSAWKGQQVESIWKLRVSSRLDRGEVRGAISDLWKVAYALESHDPDVFAALAYCYAIENHYDVAMALFAAMDEVPSPFRFEVARASRRQRQVYRYLELIRTLPVNSRVYLWESHFGRRVDCNPYAMYRSVKEEGSQQDSIHVWVANAECDLPNDVMNDPDTVVVSREAEGYWLALATAKYLVNNASFSFEFIRRDEQRYANTWHGTPLKYLGRDDRDSIYDYGNVSRNLLHCTHLFMPNAFTADIMTRHYEIDRLLDGELWISGYPRNDVLVSGAGNHRSKIFQTLGLPEDGKPVVLYAPTWRGSSKSQKFDTEKLVQDLKELGGIRNVHVIFRGHPLSAKLLKGIEMPVCVAKDSISTYDLMSISDMVVTDYSSLGIDFLVTERPVVYYVHDWETYRSERGLYFEAEELPGLVVRNIRDLVDTVQRICTQGEDGARAADLKARYGPADDGHASIRCVEIMRGKTDSKLLQPARQLALDKSQRTRLLIHHPLTGIDATEALIRSLEELDFDVFDVTLVLDHAELGVDATVQDALSRIPAQVRVLPRKGALFASAEEASSVSALYGKGSGVLGAQQRGLVASAFRREAVRLFGSQCFDFAIEWGSDSAFWTGLVAEGIDARSRILLLEEGLGEWALGAHPERPRSAQFWSSFSTILVPSDSVANELVEVKELASESQLAVVGRVVPHSANATGCASPASLEDGVIRGVYRGALTLGLDFQLVEDAVNLLSHELGRAVELTFQGSGPLADEILEASHRGSVDVDLCDWPHDHHEAAAFYVDPVRRGPLGIGALDSLSRGVPVVAVVRPDLGESQDCPSDGLFIVQATPECLAAGVQRALAWPRSDQETMQRGSHLTTSLSDLLLELDSEGDVR